MATCCGRQAAAHVLDPGRASSTDQDVVPDWDASLSVDVGNEMEAQSSRKANGYSWDLVIVMPYENSQPVHVEAFAEDTYLDEFEKTVCCVETDQTKPELKWKGMIDVLGGAGLETFAFLSVQKDEVYIKVRAPLNALRKQAMSVSYPMKLDKVNLEAKLADTPIKRDEQNCRFDPYDHIYLEYDTKYDASEGEPSLYEDSGLGHAFGSVVRLKLTDMIISRALKKSSFQTMQHLKADGQVKERGYFPLHEDAAKEKLLKAWDEQWIPSHEQFLLFRRYLGAKVALFYVYLCHHTTWTAPLALVGLAISVQVLVDGRLSTLANELFALAVPAWAICLNEFWKRTERHTAAVWGMTQFEEEEVERPDFVVSNDMKRLKFDYIVKGREVVYYPRDSTRLPKQMFSYSVSLCMVLLVFAFIGGVFYGKVTLPGVWPDVLSAVNVVGIQLFNAVWNRIAKSLATNENYRTETEYEDALIVYLFGFQFVNSFGSLYYIAFIQLFVFHVPCSDGSCLTDLSVDLIYVFVGNIVFQLAYAYLYPIFFIRNNIATEGATDEDRSYLTYASVLLCGDQRPDEKKPDFSTPEREYNMVPFDPCMDTIDKYMDLARSFGYMVLFIVAFPAAPAFVCLSNYAQIHMDVKNLLRTYQRVLPAGCQDIGTWQSIFTMLCVAAVVTNTAMIVFVMDTFDGLSMHNLPYFKAWMFILCQYVLFHVMAVFVFLIPDTPDDVRTQQQRAEFIEAKLGGEVSSDELKIAAVPAGLTRDPAEIKSPDDHPEDFPGRISADTAGGGIASSYGSDGSTRPAAGAALPSVPAVGLRRTN